MTIVEDKAMDTHRGAAPARRSRNVERDVRMIPIAHVDVLNTRERNSQAFEEIVGNIKTIGLKKPITVTPREGADGERYLLVCGEGRLKAFKALGEVSIPAQVIQVTDEEAFIMSLVENIARRHPQPLELLAGIDALRAMGYDRKDIAKKTGLTPEYVYGILTLIEKGERHLLASVERGKIPLNAALAIVGAGNDDRAIQNVLQEVYESGQLRGRQLITARRLIERRQRGNASHGGPRKRGQVTASTLVRTYQKEVERQRMMIRKAEFCQQRLLFVVNAMRQLLADEHFTNLLRAEGLNTIPRKLADRLPANGTRL
jgi:ParB family chromosome partitioning protein